MLSGTDDMRGCEVALMTTFCLATGDVRAYEVIFITMSVIWQQVACMSMK